LVQRVQHVGTIEGDRQDGAVSGDLDLRHDGNHNRGATVGRMPLRYVVDEHDALDAYSRAVIAVNERLAPPVANLRSDRGGGSGGVVRRGGCLGAAGAVGV